MGRRSEVIQHTLNTPYMVGPVHCYTAESEDGLMLFDTGPPTNGAKKYLTENVDLGRLKYVFITHCHIDHYGLASWLQEETGAELYIPYRDGLKILSHEERLKEMYVILQNLGFSGEFLEGLHNSLSDGRVFPPFPKNFRIVEDDMPDNLDVSYMGCPGHSQSDVVYFSNSWAVTGDVLLKGVFQSPLLDADLETGERFQNYASYCATLVKLATLRDKQICPGHRKDVTTVDDTLCFYIAKMLERVTYLRAYDGEESIADIIARVFGDALREPFHIYLKASEIVFMLDFLNDPGLLRDSLERIGLFTKLEQQFTGSLSIVQKELI